jgi:hypothetical protein
MGLVTAILLAAFFLAIPVGIKYLLAFETRGLMKILYEQEGEVRYLEAQLESLERERLVVSRAMDQVKDQRRWVDVRRSTKAEGTGTDERVPCGRKARLVVANLPVFFSPSHLTINPCQRVSVRIPTAPEAVGV